MVEGRCQLLAVPLFCIEYLPDYLFGSLVRGEITSSTDIDIGIQGLSPEIFFRVFDQLSEAVDSPLDLVDFDEQIDFFKMLNSVEEVIQIE